MWQNRCSDRSRRPCSTFLQCTVSCLSARRTDADRFRSAVPVMFVMMMHRRRCRSVVQHDGLPVRRIQICPAPSFLALANFGR
jgi:hypothetical protein